VEKLNEPKWKNDLVKIIWAYAYNNGLTTQDGNHDYLPKGLSDLVADVRNRCDRCGKTNVQALRDLNKSGRRVYVINSYQCCRVQKDVEDYVPKLCVNCHLELQAQRPHNTISV